MTKGADDGESINAVVDEMDDYDGGGVADADANMVFFRSHRGQGESLCPQL